MCLLAQKKWPEVIFLMETKIDCNQLELVRRRLSFVGCIGVNPISRKGGLALLWRNPDVLDIHNFSHNHISAWVKSVRGDDRWLFTDLYGEPKTHHRQRTWNLLKNIRPHDSVPWIISWDFNEIIFHFEKSRSRSRSETQMCNFR